MKKILSLTLVAAMLFSTLLLTSCNIEDLLSNFGFEGFETMGSYTTPAETTPEETTPAEPPRYTITQEEWVAAINSCNFTITITTTDSAIRETVYLITEDAMEAKLDGVSEMYYTKVGEQFYTLYQPEEGGAWIATEGGPEGSVSISHFVGISEDYFAEYLKYNEASKSYIYEEDDGKVEFSFENGKLVKMTLVEESYSYVIENAGTTTVTLPEYTIYQPKTTVTKEEFIAGFNPTNFTYTHHERMVDMNGEVLESYTVTTLVDLDSKKAERKIDGITRVYAFSDGTKTYNVTDPHQTGTWYCVEDSSSVNFETYLTVEGLLYLDDLGALFDGLTYREETKSYFYQESEGNTIEIWYEDNQLVKLELYADGELYSSVDNVGETIVILPDYTMAEN